MIATAVVPTGAGQAAPAAPRQFSLVLGGPLYQLLLRAHLADDHLLHVRRRIVVLSLLAWLPLLLISAFEGHFQPGSATVPFLMDLEVHVRFLVALPLLIAAELVVHQRMLAVVQSFTDRKLVPAESRERFERSVTNAYRLRNSLPAELALVALVYTVGIMLIWRRHMALAAATWYASPLPGGGTALTLAGMWFGYLSLPLFQFLLLRWYFRVAIWVRFLWQVSRIRLSLVPTHPDRVGGLGFLSNTVYAFALLALAHGVLLAGPLANRILFLGASLTQFKVEISVVTIFVLLLVIGPLLVFAPQLAQAKRTGLLEYGTLAERYVRDFDDKWLRGRRDQGEPLIGSSDIQSLADLNNSMDVVRTMRLAPFSKETVIQIAVFTLAPVVPLALTMMPLAQLLKTLFGVLF